ncbi:hypothetical protein KAI46_00795, partial [bacterium]|nr:hypothetical protein [bacterium]
MNQPVKIGFWQSFSRFSRFLILVMVGLMLVRLEPASAIERNRKNLLKIQLKTDKKSAKSRIVMRLNQGGYYETEEDYENQKLLIKLFEFHNFGAQPIKLVNDPLIKGVNISKKELYLEIAVYLRIDSYSFKVSLFESPAMCVVDIRATEPATKVTSPVKKTAAKILPVTAESESPPEEIENREPAAVQPEMVEEIPKPELILSSTSSPVKEEIKQPPSTEFLEPITQVKSDPLPITTEKITDSLAVVLPESPESESVSPLPTELVGDLEKESPPATLVEIPVVEFGIEIEAEKETADPKIDLLSGQELFDQALKAYQEEDYVAAEEFFSQLIDSFPGSTLNIPAQFRRFDARAQAVITASGNRDRLAGVIDEFLNVVRIHEDHSEAPWAFLQVARLYEKM